MQGAAATLQMWDMVSSACALIYYQCQLRLLMAMAMANAVILHCYIIRSICACAHHYVQAYYNDTQELLSKDR